MTILLVRHASAGERSEWDGDDRLRPLDARGRRQAAGLVESLAGYPIDRILSSPFLRCVQTVEPLAEARGLDIETRAELGEDEQLNGVQLLLRELGGEAAAVVCTHGGIDTVLGDRRYKKGSTWVLDSELRPIQYLPPPR